MSDDIRLSPPPGAMSQSLRSMGYSTPTAIADLIDNSITAGASKIIILLNWGGSAEKSTVVVSDNGAGMTFKELKNAMTPGSSSPSSLRLPGDLGRFGLGMKTASWSMGRTTVRTRKDNEDNVIHDLDYVEKKGSGTHKGILKRRIALILNFLVISQERLFISLDASDFGEEEPKRRS